MTFNNFRLFTRDQLLLIPSFLLCCITCTLTFAQDLSLTVNYSKILSISSDSVFLAPNQKLISVYNPLFNTQHTNLGLNSKTNEVYIHEFNFKTKSERIRKFTLPSSKKFDYRYSVNQITFNWTFQNIIFVINDEYFEFNLKENSFVDSQNLYFSKLLFSNDSSYYSYGYNMNSNRFSGYDSKIVKLNKEFTKKSEKTESEVDLPDDHIQLTSFIQGKSATYGNESIYFIPVSRPVVYVFDSNLTLSDSIQFDTTWKGPESLIEENSDYKKLYKSKSVKFYFNAFEDSMFTLMSNHNIYLENDSILSIISFSDIHTMHQYKINLVSKNIEHKTIPLNADCLSENSCFLRSAYFSSTCYKDLLYVTTKGSNQFPWEDNEPEFPDPNNFIFHIYVFEI